MFGKGTEDVRIALELNEDQLDEIARRAATFVNGVDARDEVPADEWLTPPQLAAYLKMSERWVAYRVGDGMPCVELGGKRRFRAVEVDAWLEANGHMKRGTAAVAAGRNGTP